MRNWTSLSTYLLLMRSSNNENGDSLKDRRSSGKCVTKSARASEQAAEGPLVSTSGVCRSEARACFLRTDEPVQARQCGENILFEPSQSS